MDDLAPPLLSALAIFLAFASVAFNGWCQLQRANRLQREVDWLQRELEHKERKVGDLRVKLFEARQRGVPYTPADRCSAYEHSLETPPST